MSRQQRSRKLIALTLSIIAILSALQIFSIAPTFVSADNTLTFQLKQLAASTESSASTATVQVNLESGDIHVELRKVAPSALYVILFDSASTSTQLGLLTADANGSADFDTTIQSGTYVGQFIVSKADLVEFTSGNLSLSIGATASASTSNSISTSSSLSSTSTTSTTGSVTTNSAISPQIVSVTNSKQVQFHVDPETASIAAGDFANFNVVTTVTGGGSGNVLLVARDVPDDSVAIFTPQSGLAGPAFHSTLTIVTSSGIQVGLYGITVVALIDGIEYTYQITLQVTSSSAVTTPSNTVSSRLPLSITTDTDARVYQSNATVTLGGHVTDNTGSAVTGATVSVQVDGPLGLEVFSQTGLATDSAGAFQVSFTLPQNASAGTYTAFASTSKAGHTNATTHTTFVVETSSTPSVVITDVYAADTTGSRSAVFTPGQTVVVWVVVENSGAPFQGVIWVQIRDPSGTPVFVQFQISTLNTGATVKIGIGFTMTSNLSSGVYTANAFVSDKLISQGGTFLASATAEFALTG